MTERGSARGCETAPGDLLEGAAPSRLPRSAGGSHAPPRPSQTSGTSSLARHAAPIMSVCAHKLLPTARRTKVTIHKRSSPLIKGCPDKHLKVPYVISLLVPIYRRPPGIWHGNAPSPRKERGLGCEEPISEDRKSTRLNSSHPSISY